jgi:hypothetical protein
MQSCKRLARNGFKIKLEKTGCTGILKLRGVNANIIDVKISWNRYRWNLLV